MDSTETTHRKKLITELATIVAARKIDERFIQMEYVEEKDEVLGELVDYYTADLLRDSRFASEFSDSEVGAIAQLARFIDGNFGKAAAWSEARTRAATLLETLRSN